MEINNKYAPADTSILKTINFQSQNLSSALIMTNYNNNNNDSNIYTAIKVFLLVQQNMRKIVTNIAITQHSETLSNIKNKTEPPLKFIPNSTSFFFAPFTVY